MNTSTQNIINFSSIKNYNEHSVSAKRWPWMAESLWIGGWREGDRYQGWQSAVMARRDFKNVYNVNYTF